MQSADLTRIIKEIGRGKNAARDLNREDARALFAAMLARAGVPVLVQGVLQDTGRVTTCEVLSAMGVSPVTTLPEAQVQLQLQLQLRERKLAFISIDTLAPPLARVLALRRAMGVRSSGHTLAKMPT